MKDSRFCVYLHRRKDNNEVFYVGHGTERRMKAACKYTRSKRWIDIVQKSGGFICEVYKNGLTKQEAVDLEIIVAANYSSLINGKISSPREYPSEEYFSKFFAYSEGSPSGLISLKNGKPCGGKRANHLNG